MAHVGEEDAFRLVGGLRCLQGDMQFLGSCLDRIFKLVLVFAQLLLRPLACLAGSECGNAEGQIARQLLQKLRLLRRKSSGLA